MKTIVKGIWMDSLNHKALSLQW